MDTVRSFRDARKYLASIPSINSGGCGVAALAMRRFLKKASVSSDLFYETHREADEELLESNTPLAPPHVVIRVHGVIQDSSRIRSDSGGIIARHIFEVSEDYLVLSIKEGRWNCRFDRTYVPEIEEKLGVDLSDIRGY